MGMAASQARYLQITARKINTEYEGQQINQQRTMLANQSAGLFSQLMALNVPTAPSSTDFTTLQYSFSDGNHDYTITNVENLQGDPNFNAKVSYYYNSDVYTGIDSQRADLGIKLEGTTYWLSNGLGQNMSKLEIPPTQAADPETYEKDYAAILQICKDNSDSDFAADVDYNPTAQTVNPQGCYKYKSADGYTYYLGSEQVEDGDTSGNLRTLDFYYAANVNKKIYNDKKAYLRTSDSGRYSEITLDGYSTSFDMTAKTETDQKAYNDAMNEYQYQKDLYDKHVSDINAKTEVIEQEDRVLELKLARLDTEQEALQTELEAVKKVINKNIEETFKTFAN